MQRITRDKTVGVDRRYKVTEPVAEVELGESFVVETINFRTPIIRTPEDANPETYREREETGPIFVKGIRPGDVIAVHVESIEPEGHASGGWWDDPKVASFLEIKDGRVHFQGGLWAAEHYMIGDIYVTPTEAVPNPWDNGGNMDFRDISPPNALHLKTCHEGALLVLGDVHACQGDGEVLGLGAECAANVTVRIEKDETYLPERPMVKKPGGFVAIACRNDYAEARDLAARDASTILSRLADVTEKEAFLYCTTAGSLRNGAIWYMGRDEHPPVVVGLDVPTPFLKNA